MGGAVNKDLKYFRFSFFKLEKTRFMVFEEVGSVFVLLPDLFFIKIRSIPL